MAVPSTPSRDKLTDYLMGIDGEGFKNATQAKFLEKAGGGTLAKSALQQWLSQDRLYAQAYVRFASLLLANIPLPSSVSPEDTNEQYVLSPSSHALLSLLFRLQAELPLANS